MDQVKRMNKALPILLILGLALICGAVVTSGGGINTFLNIPSLILVLLLPLLLTLATHGFGEIGASFRAAASRDSLDKEALQNAVLFFRSLSRYMLLSGFTGTITGFIALLAFADDSAAIAANMSLALITTYYAIVLYLVFCLPFLVALRKKQIDEAKRE